jgi:large subunit ribosomal protein L15
MKLHELAPPKGAKTERRRVGRGLGSGRGKTSGKGMKGQKSRSGGKIPLYFEGGQLPLVRRLPYRRGFNNVFRVEYEVVNLDQLEKLEASGEVTPEVLRAAGLVRRNHKPVKVLARGSLEKSVAIQAHAFSAAARQAIEAAGGKVTVLGAPAEAVEASAAPAAEASAPARARAPRRAAEAPAAAESPAAPEASPEATAAAADEDATVVLPTPEEKPSTGSSND